jgi:hypothetical protein
MKATAQYLKTLLEIQRRETRAEKHHLRRIKDLDFDSYTHEAEEMPDWAKALRKHNNNVRSV